MLGFPKILTLVDYLGNVRESVESASLTWQDILNSNLVLAKDQGGWRRWKDRFARSTGDILTDERAHQRIQEHVKAVKENADVWENNR